MHRIGFGYDVHQLQSSYDLWIGGVLIPHEKGAVGHSDADVLLHAICDALLGAANLGDIGSHFPDNDNKYKGISSIILLEEVMKKIEEESYIIENIDCTVCLQRPKMAPHIPEMKKRISEVLKTDAISIKATTTEKLGFVGEEKGISAYAVCLLKK